MIGESGVGKTCIINRYISNIFDSTDPTKAASFKSYSIPSPDGSTDIRQMIWDTAGQEIYRSLASFYYKDADAVILVYDITNEKSFIELDYWIGEVNLHGSKDIIVTVAGNKSDKIDDEKVDVITAKTFAKNNNASFFLVSAKENSNIREMYTELAMRKFPELQSTFGFDKKSPKKDEIKPTKKDNSNKGCVKLVSKCDTDKNKKCC